MFHFQGERESVSHETLDIDPDVAGKIGRVLLIEQRFPDGTARTIFDARATSAAPVALGFSGGLGSPGKDVMDPTAKARIEDQHASLIASGIAVNASEQVAASGTRMMSVGYDTQAQRAREHADKLPAREAIDAIVAEVEGEKRRDIVVSAAEIAQEPGMQRQDQGFRS